MKIVNVDSKIIEKLRTSGISEQMKTLESSDWLVIDENNEDITGAAGMGGIFHVSSIQVNQNFRGRGIGKMLQGKLIQEAKRRGFSFVTVFIDPRNQTSVKLHDSFNYSTIFRIHYSDEIIQDVKIIIFKPRGNIVKKFLGCFNSKIGIFLLACVLKVTKPLFKKMVYYSEENIPSPSIKTIVSKFEKI